MKTIKEYINDLETLASIFEDIDSSDKQYYEVLDKNKEYTLWIDKHAIKRQSRHSDFSGDKTEHIDNIIIKKSIQAAFPKIESLFGGNRLTANKDNTSSFCIINTKPFIPVNIIGFVYKLNQDATYDICIKTVIMKDNFIPLNKNGKHTSTIKINESLNLNIFYVNI